MSDSATLDRSDLDAQYDHLLADVDFRPVFVMGDHRSGTTILYKILNATGRFNIVTVYHIARFNRLVYDHVNGCSAESKEELNDYLRQRGMQDRVFDRMTVDADTPEEYGFILRNGGARPQLKTENVADLVTLCRKLQLTSGNTLPILLKNPWDYFRNFMYVKQVFPDSKFIFIHRYPPPVINSQMTTMHSLLSTKNEYVALVAAWYDALFRQPVRLALTRFMFSSHFDLGLRWAVRHVQRAAEYYMEHSPYLSDEDCVTVRYEDLCADPGGTVDSIMQALDMGNYADIDYARYIKARDVPLADSLARRWPKISHTMKPYLDRFDYEA
ncbi:MAG: sulfotransferase [Anaerolineae bacterium]|nr:sulfotransferase [Anaerolineae bacterium]MCB0198614.1 sulfotransferase [Anaerolineae bacterium]MCB0203276.1 sulfotransferase [Anaerolineae bacterium]MCB0254444.1 sulfotransferase [Anaerolineae bacterium]